MDVAVLVIVSCGARRVELAYAGPPHWRGSPPFSGANAVSAHSTRRACFCFTGFPLTAYLRPHERAAIRKMPLTNVRGIFAVRMGLEPTTPGVTGPYSNQLNYRTRSCCVWFVSQTRMQSYV